MSMYGGSLLQRKFTPTNLFTPCEPYPQENRIHKRKKIVDELDMIKFRVNQIMESYDKESKLYFQSSSGLDYDIPTLTLQSLLKQHEVIGFRRERELSAVRDFFRKFMERFLDETEDEEFDYISEDEFQIPDIDEFLSAIEDVFQMLHKLNDINNQLVEKVSDLLKKNDPQQHDSGSSVVDGGSFHRDKFLSMYTQEAIKSGRLEKDVRILNEELQHLRIHNSYLVEKNEAGISRLNEMKTLSRELEESIEKMKVEIKTLKVSETSAVTQTNNNLQTSQIPNGQLTNQLELPSPQPKTSTHRKDMVTIESPSPTKEENKEENKKEVKVPPRTVSKKQASVKHTSRLLEQQLNNMEELVMQGQKSITLAEKEMADLVYITDETLQHKYGEQCSNLAEAVDVTMAFLGKEGSEKLVKALSSATPSSVVSDKKKTDVSEMAERMKTSISRVTLELKLFIKLKKRLATNPSSSARRLFCSEKPIMNVTQLQEWLRKELFGINEEIDRSVQHYEQQKMEIKTRQEVYLNQLSEKVNDSIQKISKSMKRLEVPDDTKSMLGDIMTVAGVLKEAPTCNPQFKHSNTMQPAASDMKANLEVDTACLHTRSIPALDVIRKNVAVHLREKHGINIRSRSWRTKAFLRKETFRQRKVADSRKLLIPSMANCVDFDEYRASKTTSKSPSEPFPVALETAHLPTIHLHEPRASPALHKKIERPYHAFKRDAAANSHTRILAYRVP